MHEFIVSIVAFIVLVGVMVVVHEFGHFAMAKLCGVRVEAFSIGFGPRLFGVRHGETDYKVCLLPLGGYVKMTGETPDHITGPTSEGIASDPGAFTSHPRWQRMLIGVAGPVANFILAFVLMAFYFGVINEVPLIRPVSIEWVVPGSAAAQAGIKTGDVVYSFGDQKNPDLEAILDAAGKHGSAAIPVTVQRAGALVSTSLSLASEKRNAGPELPNTGIYFQYIDAPIQVNTTMPGAPAAQAGLLPNDKILAVDGHSFHTLEPMLEYLKEGQGRPVALTVERNGHALPAPVVVNPVKQDATWIMGFYWVPPDDSKIQIIQRPMKLTDAFTASNDFCVDNSTMIMQVLRRLITRQASVKELSGPVGIARVAGEAAQMQNWSPKFALAAGISLNLGILNLLPFPILDGGLILLLMIESVLRHDISMVVKERIYQAAFVVLVMFFVYVSFNDISRLPFFTHLHQ